MSITKERSTKIFSQRWISEINSLAEKDLPKVQSEEEGYLASAKDQNFGTFFGRDSEISSIFTCEKYRLHPDRPDLLIPVKKSLTTMNLWQGKVIDDARDEEPGKIIHELRQDRNRQNSVNQEWLGKLQLGGWPVDKENGILAMRYYGSVDSTPLFVYVASEYLGLTSDRKFFRLLDPAIRKAISWMFTFGDSNHDGYIDYSAKNRNALANQGWKDSNDSIKNSQGEHPAEPIALVEIQGYFFAALVKAAQLYKEFDPYFSALLRQKADKLKENFNKDFWMEDTEFFTYAINGKGAQIREITSNVGHLLMTGIVDEDKLPFVVKRLMQPDILTKYGIRSLSLTSTNFSDKEPAAYHNGGSVWPHDNAIIYLGLKKTGFYKEAGLIRDAVLFAQHLLRKRYGVSDTELYMVDRYGRLRPYKTAQHPQSWAVMANLLWADPLEIQQLLHAA